MDQNKNKKRILIFGIFGLVGYNIYLKCQSKYNIFGTCRLNGKKKKHKNIYAFEHTKENIDKHIELVKPDVVINCIVVLRENNNQEKQQMIESNCLIPSFLSEICQEKKIYFIHFSTDAVFFPSTKVNDINSICSAITFYGLSKRMAELSVKKNGLVLRICPIGFSPYNNRSLFNFIYNNGNTEINGFENCIFNGSSIFVVIRELELIIDNLDFWENGIRHISTFKISKYELLKLINKEFQLGKKIIPKSEPNVCRLLKNDLVNFKTTWKDQIRELYKNMYLFNPKK